MIRLNDKFGIEVSDKSYVLCRLRVSTGKKNKGETYSAPLGYFTGLGEALNAFRKEVIREGLKDGILSLSEAVTRVEESNTKVEEMIKEAFKERE